MWEDRMLKASEMIRMPVRCVWVATGNNPSLSPELTRRSIRIRMDSKQDRPWLRSGFRHKELRRWAIIHRGELVWSALTLIRAWLVAGREAGQRSLGMFEDWALTMGGILATAGIPGFLENLTEFYEASDADDQMWRTFVAAWWDRFKGEDVKVAQLFGLLNDSVTLPLGDKGEQSQKIRLGKLLTENRDRTFQVEIEGAFQSVRLVRGDLHQRAYQWKLTL
jgi:hypothetical protein